MHEPSHSFSAQSFLVIQFSAALLVPYSAWSAENEVPAAMLAMVVLTGTNLGVLVDALRSAYVA
jgi:hypothetical protein